MDGDMKTTIGLVGAAAFALAGCGSSPEATTADASTGTGGDTQGSFTATDPPGDPSGDPSGATDSQSGTTDDPTTGMSNSGNSDPDPTTAGPTSASQSGTDSDATTDATTTAPGTTDATTDGTTEPLSASDTDTGDTTGDTGTDDTTSDTSESDTGMMNCGTELDATVRDFKFEHPDFEDYGGNAAYKGLVQNDLGPDDKPVYAHPGPTPQTSGPDAFKQWYNDTPGVNQTFMVKLPLTEVQPGLYQFADNTFFPIDGLGWGNEGQPNNFAFTTEIHTEFVYNGGEVFTFTGDDDVWVFINKKLAIDLGGLHPQLSDSIDLDDAAATLGIQPGNSYAMDIFHAERHTNESNFRIDTTIGCFIPQ
jgi:fibro-slime domain-containing protein